MDDQETSRRDVLMRGAVLGAAGVALTAGKARAAAQSKNAAAQSVTQSKNIDVLLAFCKAGQDRDIEAQMAFIPDDGIYHNMPDEPIKGKAGIRALLSGYLTSSDATEIIVYAAAEAKPGLVLTERLDRFRAQGKWIECPVMGAAEVENGKIKHWRDYYDNTYVFKQMK